MNIEALKINLQEINITATLIELELETTHLVSIGGWGA
jgi:hypothetical protein